MGAFTHTHKPRSAPRLHVKMCQSTKRPFNTEHYVRLDIYLKSFMEGIVADNKSFVLSLKIASVQQLTQELTVFCCCIDYCIMQDLSWLWLDNSCALSRKCLMIQGEGKAFNLYSSPLGLRSRLQAGLHSWPHTTTAEKASNSSLKKKKKLVEKKNCWK